MLPAIVNGMTGKPEVITLVSCFHSKLPAQVHHFRLIVKIALERYCRRIAKRKLQILNGAARFDSRRLHQYLKLLSNLADNF
jgi:hypothetical protein